MPLTDCDLPSQPTMSRFENRITRTDSYPIAKAFADVFVASSEEPPEAILLDIDDTKHKVYGSQPSEYEQSSRLRLEKCASHCFTVLRENR